MIYLTINMMLSVINLLSIFESSTNVQENMIFDLEYIKILSIDWQHK